MPQRIGKIQQQILLLLLGGLVLSLCRSPRHYFRVVKGIKREWEKIEKRALYRAIRSLYKSKLISKKENSDGTITIILTDKGKNRALTFHLDKMKIPKPLAWDKKWRVVLFDVPEKRKQARDILRFHLKRLGFCELQKSVFVFPYECRDEINFLIEFYDIKKHVRYLIADYIDNELHLRKKFNL